MIEKPTILVTSLGRTGTQFFQVFFQEMIYRCTSLHEPDFFNFGQYHGAYEKTKQAVRQIKESGFFNLTVRKMLGQWDLLQISDERIKQNLSYKAAVKKVYQQRAKFVERQVGDVYVESSSAYRGLIDVLSGVYANHKIVYVLRDGRDWVRSKMNFGITYGHGRVRAIVQPFWPTAYDFENDPYQAQWGKMSRFEKLCWAWERLNRYALDTVKMNPNAKVFYFEDIFKSKESEQYLKELLSFVTDLDGVKVPSDNLSGWVKRQIHQSSGNFPRWTAWTSYQKMRFDEICGDLMQEQGYDLY